MTQRNMTEDLLNPDDSIQKLFDYEFTVKNSFWSSHLLQSENPDMASREGADRLKLFWHVNIDKIHQPDYDGEVPETKVMSYGIGSGWTPDPSDPAVVVHENDPSPSQREEGRKLVRFRGPGPKNLEGVSGLGRILALITGQVSRYETENGECTPLDGGGPVDYAMTSAAHYLRSKGFSNPRDARIWIGTRWRSRGLHFDYGGFSVTSPWPTAFLGASDDVAAGVPTVKDFDQLAAEVAGALPPSTSPDLVERIAKLVEVSSSFSLFVKNALKLSEVSEDEELKTRVLSEEGPFSVK